MNRALCYHRENCRICGRRELELVIPVAATPVGDAYAPPERSAQFDQLFPLDVYLCRSCGLVQLLDVVREDFVYGDYLYETSVSLGLAEHFQKYADEAIQRLELSGSDLVVDIGSNDGTLLRSFKRAGIRVLGVEPARRLAEKACLSGIDTISAFFTKGLAERIRSEKGEVGLITANNVLANVDQLDEFVQGIKELLHSRGCFVFETGYLLDLVKNLLFDNIYHEHLCYFSVRPLQKLFSRHGLELFHVSRITTKGGSIRGWVQISSGPQKVSDQVQEFIRMEDDARLYDPSTYARLVKRIEGRKEKLHKLLQEECTKGKRTVGYGASVGVTTLLYHFQLADFISFLVDDDPRRHGLVSPGLHIPVWPSSKIYEDQIDNVLLLAWRYADTIMKKHAVFTEHGGKFIQLLPNVRFV